MKLDPYSLITSVTSVLSPIYLSISKFPYTRYIIIGLGIFLILLVFGKERHFAFHFSKRGAVFGFFFGITVMLFINIVLILGVADRNKLQDLFSNKEQKNMLVKEVFYSGLSNLNKVLGVSSIVAGPKAQKAEVVVGSFMSLSKEEQGRASQMICK